MVILMKSEILHMYLNLFDNSRVHINAPHISTVPPSSCLSLFSLGSFFSYILWLEEILRTQMSLKDNFNKIFWIYFLHELFCIFVISTQTHRPFIFKITFVTFFTFDTPYWQCRPCSMVTQAGLTDRQNTHLNVVAKQGI